MFYSICKKFECVKVSDLTTLYIDKINIVLYLFIIIIDKYN